MSSQERALRVAQQQIGNQRMYMPYHNWRMHLVRGDPAQLLGPHHYKPEMVRHELRRVWVVEATPYPGVRHMASKKRFYLDEDTWAAIAYEGWDHSNKLFRVDAVLRREPRPVHRAADAAGPRIVHPHGCALVAGGRAGPCDHGTPRRALKDQPEGGRLPPAAPSGDSYIRKQEVRTREGAAEDHRGRRPQPRAITARRPPQPRALGGPAVAPR